MSGQRSPVRRYPPSCRTRFRQRSRHSWWAYPYLDDNGRIGRLLVTLLLEHFGVLSLPLLYLGLFFKRHRDEYYRRLAAVWTDGDWEGWTAFFLEAVATTAGEATTAARDIFGLISRDRQRVLDAKSSTVMAARLFEMLPEQPIVTIAKATSLLDTTKPTASKRWWRWWTLGCWSRPPGASETAPSATAPISI